MSFNWYHGLDMYVWPDIVPQTLTGLRRAEDVYSIPPVKCLFKYIKIFVTGVPEKRDNRQINKKTIVS